MSILGDKERVTKTHVYFVGGPLSQWYGSPFYANHFLCEMMHYTGKIYKYVSCEQYMMHNKAILFQDVESSEKIMATSDPKTLKALGRNVKNFNEELWNKLKFHIVVIGNIHKFNQNEHLSDFIESTENRTLVEAAWYDAVWGIGLAPHDDRVLDESNWKGENLLGKALMVARDYLTNIPKYDEYRKVLNSVTEEIIVPLVSSLRSK